jgi:hypothetical protein
MFFLLRFGRRIRVGVPFLPLLLQLLLKVLSGCSIWIYVTLRVVLGKMMILLKSVCSVYQAYHGFLFQCVHCLECIKTCGVCVQKESRGHLWLAPLKTDRTAL